MYLTAWITATAHICYSQPFIIPVGHSHNDYKRRHPLHDALRNGFCSVEADIFFHNGLFSVAHTQYGIRKNRTLEKMYLQPLHQIVTKNNGYVYSDSMHLFELMLDLKGSWNKEYLKLLDLLLEKYETILDRHEKGNHLPGAVRVILSGKASLSWIEHTKQKWLFYFDVGFGEPISETNLPFIGRFSSCYKDYFSWRGIRPIPTDEKNKIRQITAQANMYNIKTRFWSCPHRKKIWNELLCAGIGWINVDRLSKFRKFYLKKP